MPVLVSVGGFSGWLFAQDFSGKDRRDVIDEQRKLAIEALKTELTKKALGEAAEKALERAGLAAKKIFKAIDFFDALSLTNSREREVEYAERIRRELARLSPRPDILEELGITGPSLTGDQSGARKIVEKYLLAWILGLNEVAPRVPALLMETADP